MAIDFPGSPTNGQTFTSGSVTYTYDGTKWTALASGGGATDKIEEGNTSAEVIDTGSDGRFVVTTEGTERLRVDSSGRLLVGTSSARTSIAGIAPQSQIEGTTYDTSSFSLTLNSNDAQSPYLEFAKTRATLIGGATVVQSGDQLGYIGFAGADGSDVGQNAAAIAAYVDGTPGANDMPGRLVFSTTADGASSPTERMRISQNGDVLLGTSNPSATAGSGFKYVHSATNPEIRAVLSVADNSVATYQVYSTTASAYRFYVGLAGTVYATNTSISGISDVRLKENIRDIDAGLSEILALKPRTYDWKPGKGKDTKGDRGFIAQEFEQVFPELIDEWRDPAPEGEEPYKSVRQDLIPVLVKAIQEQQAMIAELQNKVAALEGV